MLPPSLLVVRATLIVGPPVRHTFHRPTTMPDQDRGIDVSRKIHSLFLRLDIQTYDEVTPKIEYWTELALTQQFTTVDKLAEEVSFLPWTTYRCPASFARFLKEFRNSPRRSTQARSFVNDLSTRLFWWFAAASAEVFTTDWHTTTVARNGGRSFVEAAWFVGYLIRCDLLDHELVRLHLIKPLTTYYYPRLEISAETVRAKAIYRLFAVAGSTLVQGLLEPGDVQVCFEILGTQSSGPGGVEGLSAAKLKVQCATHPNTPHWNPLTRKPGTSRAPCQVVVAE